jgi:hypothetical protein
MLNIVSDSIFRSLGRNFQSRRILHVVERCSNMREIISELRHTRVKITFFSKKPYMTVTFFAEEHNLLPVLSSYTAYYAYILPAKFLQTRECQPRISTGLIYLCEYPPRNPDRLSKHAKKHSNPLKII